MKYFAVAGGVALILFGTAMGASILESLVHRRRKQREAMLHRRMGLGVRDDTPSR